VLGILDYRAAPDVSFIIFYLPPVLLATWYAGFIPGLILSVFAALLWFYDDVSGVTFTRNVTLYWDTISRCFVFVLTVKLVSTLKNRMEKEKLAEQEKISREFEIARNVQTRLLPAYVPQLPGIKLGGICVPAQQVGGDYYDFIQLTPTKIGIAIGDVSGKGLPSALTMAQLQGMVRSTAYLYPDNPAAVMKVLNRLLMESTDLNRFVTFFYGLFDSDSKTFTYSNAGHYPAVLLKNGDSHETIHLAAVGTVLGVNSTAQYQDRSVSMGAGDSLILYTDGITEATNQADEEFGENRLIDSFSEHSFAELDQLCKMVLTDVVRFANHDSQQDDMTLVLLRVT
jgi:sigma-B regulation protein RsbU (phosphoserine phosphatase)